jgi:hypothetical protein
MDTRLPWNHSRWQPLMQTRTTDLWLQTPPFTPSLQTTLCYPQLRFNARSYKHTFPSPYAHSLFYMPISLGLRPLRFSSLLGITLHNNCIKRLHNYSTKSLAQRRDSTTRPAVARTKQKPQNWKLKMLPCLHFLPPQIATTSLQIFLPFLP